MSNSFVHSDVHCNRDFEGSQKDQSICLMSWNCLMLLLNRRLKKKKKNDTCVCTKTALKETDIWRGTHGCEKPDMTC